MKITFIGHGYVGLVTAAVFADLGHTISVLGRTQEKIDKLNSGIPTFYEPGLEELLKKNLKEKRLHFTIKYEEVIPDSDVVFIAVGTPPKKTGEADLTAVFTAAEEAAKYLRGYTVVSTKSTVPPGTNRKVGEILQKLKPKDAEFDVASVPEFLREGSALTDTFHPDRVVIGTESQSARDMLVEAHKPIDSQLVLCNIETAELIKYASNALLSTKISFANALSFLSEKVGADVEKVLEGVGMDRRIGRSFLYPGIGYGGSCFPKDVKALIAIAQEHGYSFDLLKSVHAVNAEAAGHFINKITTALKPTKGKKVAILGLSFKPDTDDMREAPSITIISALQAAGMEIHAYDPIAMPNAKEIFENVVYYTNPYEAISGCDAVAILTEWDEFKQLDLKKVKTMLNCAILFDGRNIYEPDLATQLGYTYYGVGR